MPEKTIAQTYPTEIAAVRAAVTAVENAVEVYLSDDPDEAYHSIQEAISVMGTLAEAADPLYEALCKEGRRLEDL